VELFTSEGALVLSFQSWIACSFELNKMQSQTTIHELGAEGRINMMWTSYGGIILALGGVTHQILRASSPAGREPQVRISPTKNTEGKGRE